jgi:hypothetical protein
MKDALLLIGAIRNRSFSHEQLVLFTFKDASSSEGLLVLLHRARQARQSVLERKPHDQCVAARAAKEKPAELSRRALISALAV